MGEHIYCPPQTDCFILSELFSVARHAGRSKPGSKPVQLYVRLSFRPFGQYLSSLYLAHILAIFFYSLSVSFLSIHLNLPMLALISSPEFLFITDYSTFSLPLSIFTPLFSYKFSISFALPFTSPLNFLVPLSHFISLFPTFLSYLFPSYYSPYSCLSSLCFPLSVSSFLLSYICLVLIIKLLPFFFSLYYPPIFFSFLSNSFPSFFSHILVNYSLNFSQFFPSSSSFVTLFF